MLAAVAGGSNVLVLASDSAHVGRDSATGTELQEGEWERPAWLRGKLYSLSAQHPIAAGAFGLSGCQEWGRAASVPAVMARCRVRPLAATYTVRDVAERVGRELFDTFSERLKEIERRRWPEPADDMPAGARPGGAFVGGLVAGYPGGDGPPEAWFFLVTATGLAELERKFRGGPDRWGVAISPGADAAAAAYREIVREVPRTLEHAATMARSLIETQIAAGPSPNGPTVGGPVQLLGLVPGEPPRVMLDSTAAAA